MTKKTDSTKNKSNLSSQTTDSSNDENAKLLTRIQEIEQQYQRLAADFDNYRKRTETERSQIMAYAKAETLLALTPVLDNFTRATSHLPAELNNNSWVTGILYVEKQLEQIFNQLGLTKINTTGQNFDPNFHEAIEYIPSDEIIAGQIISEVESGFTLNNLVLKPAKVKVSSGQTPTTN